MTRKHDNKPKRASNRPAKVGKAPRAKRGVNRGRAVVHGDAQGCKEARPAGRGPAARPCALCPVFGRCGGCSQLDVPYEAQLAAKQQRVAALFEGLAPADAMLPIIGMEESFHYRNKVISPYAPAKGKARRAGGKGKGGDARLTRDDILTGMYAPGSHRLIPTDACAIENETAKRVTLAIRDIMARWGMEPYDEDAGTGFVRHAVVRVGHESGEVLVTVVTNGDEFPSAKSFCRELVRRVPEITTIVQNVNTRATNVILGEKERVLYDEAIRLAGLTGAETVIDAYCGTGTIGLVAAKRGAARVIGVDAVESAIRDAAGNARHNGVKNAAFVAEDATAFMEELAASGERPCPLVLLMDPPRAGSTPAFLAAAATLAPERIVYISCNPATQARDVRQLVDAGYVVRTVRPVDMFPHTDHVESIVMLEREAKRSTIVGAVCGGDGGRSGRASSAATGSAQWALSQSEDCLSESEYPAAPTEEPL